MKLFKAAALVMVLSLIPGFVYATDDDAAKSVELVDKAVDYFQSKGREYALKVINAGSGPLREGSIYVFALSLDNTILAHPVNKELVGKNVDDFQDAAGKYLFREFADAALNRGSGWVEYLWKRKGEDEPTPKRSFIRIVPNEDIYVGAGYYLE